jgi:hypothetical protein
MTTTVFMIVTITTVNTSAAAVATVTKITTVIVLVMTISTVLTGATMTGDKSTTPDFKVTTIITLDVLLLAIYQIILPDFLNKTPYYNQQLVFVHLSIESKVRGCQYKTSINRREVNE